MRKIALAIMARTPALYQTKTRLAAGIGHEAALAAHNTLVEDTLTRLQPSVLTAQLGSQPELDDNNLDVALWVTATDSAAHAWSTDFGFPIEKQSSGDLGQRMHGIFETLFRRGASAVCLVGTDCPTIDAAYVISAFNALQKTDVVFAPAEDGGYGLVGLDQAAPDLFSGIPWGSRSVLEKSLHVAQQKQMRVSLQPTVWDVDTESDWLRYLQYKQDN